MGSQSVLKKATNIRLNLKLQTKTNEITANY